MVNQSMSNIPLDSTLIIHPAEILHMYKVHNVNKYSILLGSYYTCPAPHQIFTCVCEREPQPAPHDGELQFATQRSRALHDIFTTDDLCLSSSSFSSSPSSHVDQQVRIITKVIANYMAKVDYMLTPMANIKR